MKLFAAFTRPSEAVREAMEKPNLGLAIALILLPGIIGIITILALGMPADFMAVGMRILGDVLAWVLAAAVIYLLAFVFRGVAVKGKFTAILTALSLIGIMRTLAAVVAIILLLFLAPQSPSIMGSPAAANLSASELTTKVVETAPDYGMVGLIVLAMGLLLGTLFPIIMIYYIFYRAISESAQAGLLKNLLVWLILVAALMFFQGLWAAIPGL